MRFYITPEFSITTDLLQRHNQVQTPQAVANELVKLGWEIISTGGTYKILKESGLNIINSI